MSTKTLFPNRVTFRVSGPCAFLKDAIQASTVSFKCLNFVQFIDFSFVICAFVVLFEKALPNPRSQRFIPMFFSKSLKVLAIVFRFEFIFVSGGR